MEKQSFDPFAAALNYIPSENDMTLEDAINCAMKYEEEKKKKNQRFLESMVNISDEDIKLKDRLLYILNNVDITCEENKDVYSLTIESTLNGLEIYLTFELNKNSANPKIKCTSEENEIESIISSFLLKYFNIKEFIAICKMNSVYDNKEYRIKVINLPVELTLSDDRIFLNSTNNIEGYQKNIFTIYPYSKDIYVDQSLPKEGFNFTIVNNLIFFAKACYVKKSDIPEELYNFGFDPASTLERIIETSDIGDDREKIETYYVALPTGIIELEGVEEINDAEDDSYKCIFEDGSSLEFAKDKLFTVTKTTKKFTMAEKALGLKEK